MTLNLQSCFPKIFSCSPILFFPSPILFFCSPTLFSSTPKVFSHAPTLLSCSPKILFCNPDLHSCFPTLLFCSLLINYATHKTIETYNNYRNNKKQLYTTNGQPLTHAYAHLLADMYLAVFAPAFTLELHESEAPANRRCA